jgi:excisionase family DNA binding protein
MKKDVEKQVYRIAEFCIAFGICRSKTYEEIATKRLKVFKVGRATLIRKEDALAWLDRSQREFDEQRLVAGGAR